ncbi:endo-1,4-beta-xylanase [Sphingobacterium bovistauri]|uniref:Beta-xylanase n=1 Tax=Sphingobacterium bovistauri TaxID=2781959 RepID=A0ABS7Z396_9SPHI|nr:endo-1,4-beta-xylanase [Sphingobacterium bovistauri]MCA5004639.1 endo-1,4-beta-xylanase [Sphingobacterium bovistauri]
MNIIKTILLVGVASVCVSCSSTKSKSNTSISTATNNVLKDAYKDKFHLGTALNLDQIWGRNQKAVNVIESHFNSIVAENCMKGEVVQPQEGVFDFKDADKFVEFGEKNRMKIIGHTLIWHSQPPKWFFTDKDGKDVSREVMIERMRKHIYTVVTRYKGRVHGWDVVNEAIVDNGEWRKSKYYQIVGEDFISLAFKFAHEADPNVELYYNDYSTAVPAKREGIYRMVKKLIEDGRRVDGIGMQEHNGLDYPSIQEVENTINRFSSLGTKVMVTEMEITVLPSARPNMGAEISDREQYRKELNPYVDGLPADKQKQVGDRYVEFFKLFLKHQDKIDRVTLWGVGDGDSWKNGWPIPGRKDYPLLFDRNYDAKPFVQDIINLVKK